MVKPFFVELERYVVGVAQVGSKRKWKLEAASFTVRRVIAVRSRFGVTSYYYYRGDDKGRQLYNIQWFIPIKHITREQFAKVKLGL
jgi:hypothetical protein